MRKAIKKIRTIFTTIVLVIMGLLLISFGIMFIPPVQNYVKQKICESIETTLGVRTNIKSVKYFPFSTLQLSNIEIFDKSDSLLLNIPSLKAEIALSSIVEKRIIVESLLFDSAKVLIYTRRDNKLNISDLSLMNDSSNNNNLKISTIRFRDGQVKYFSNNDSIIFSKISILLDNLNISDDKISTKIVDFKTSNNKTNSDLSLSTYFQKDSDYIYIKNFKVEFDESLALIDTAGCTFKNGDICTAEADFAHILISKNELQLFDFIQDKIKSDIWINGHLTYDDERLNAHCLQMRCADGTNLISEFTIDNIKDLSNTNINININKLATTINDISSITGINIIEDDIAKKLGEINFNGRIVGDPKDLLFEGTLNSSIGAIGLSANMKKKNEKKTAINGQVNAPNMDFSHLTNNKLSTAAFNAKMDALLDDKKLTYNHIKGNFDFITFNKYTYQNVILDVMMQDNSDYGVINFSDKNGTIIAVAEHITSDNLPQYIFTAKIEDLHTGAINITPNIPDGNLNLTMQSNFEGNTFDNIKGLVWIGDLQFKGLPRLVSTKSFTFEVDEDKEGLRHATITSDNLKGKLDGQFKLTNIIDELNYQVSSASEALNPTKKRVNNEDIYMNFDIEYDDIDQYLQFITSNLSLDKKGKIKGFIDSRNHSTDIEVSLGNIRYNANELDNAVATFSCNDKHIAANLTAQTLALPIFGTIEQFSINNTLYDNTLQTNTTWKNKKKQNKIGEINTQATFVRENDKLNYFVHIDSSTIIIADSIWTIHPSKIYAEEEQIKVDNFKVDNGNRFVAINGSLSKDNATDSLLVTLKRISISDFLHDDPTRKFALSGNVSANAKLTYSNKLYADASIGIDSFYVNHDRLDKLDMRAAWKPDKELLDLGIAISTDNKQRARAIGALNTRDNNFDLKFNIDSISDGFLNYYLHEPIKDIKGSTSGWLRLHGTLPDLKIDAHLCVHKTDFTVRQTLVTYTFDGNDTLIIAPNYVEFCNMQFSDPYGNHGNFYGHISHNMFSGLGLHINFKMNNQLVLNTTAKDNPTYYGKLFADGLLNVSGTTSNPFLNIEATTQKNSEFIVQPLEKSDISEQDYIKFSSKANNNLIISKNDILDGVAARVDVHILPNAQIQAVINPRTGNMITANGEGKIRLNIDKSGDLSIFGNYAIDNGIYNFSFGNIVDKKFIINKGGNIVWDGNAYNANIDLTATYKVKAALSDLVANNPDVDITDLKRRIPINCNIILSNKLIDPTIRFKIEVPSSQNFNQYTFDQYVNTEEETNRQVFSLLLTNRFYAVQNADANVNNQNYISSTAADLLSSQLTNQLSNWMSQNKYNIGVGVNYRPGDEVTNEEYEVALSTQMLDNKIILSGNIGYGRNATETSDGSFIGDFDVEVKINKKGNLRAKAYTHSNNDIIYETSPTTQGIGISFNEEFNTFGELMHKYWDIITFRRHREAKKDKK